MNPKPALSKSTFRGTLVFVVLLVLIFLLPDLWMYFHPVGKEHISFYDPAFQRAVRSVQRNAYRQKYRKTARYSVPPEAFDPNTYTLEQWMSLGLSEKQAAVVLKFTKYGLRSNDDLKKIFVISEELYALIKDSTRYPERTNSYADKYPAVVTPVQEPKAVHRLDINTATIDELMTVRGIGPYFAKQIVKRRDELGGFYAESQLMEVWKMDEEKLGQMAPSLLFTETGLRKLHLNTATVEELKAHPYISWNLANSIVKLRSQNGDYKRIEEVKKSVLMTDDLYEKLKRYLTVDP